MGKSSSDASTKTSTKYETTTSTTIGDIGFTGKDAIAFEAALLQYNAVSQQQVFNALNNMQTRASSFGPSGGGGPTESEADADSQKKTTDYKPLLILGGVGAVLVYFLFLR